MLLVSILPVAYKSACKNSCKIKYKQMQKCFTGAETSGRHLSNDSRNEPVRKRAHPPTEWHGHWSVLIPTVINK